jgi:hypothetical protein
MSRAFSFALSAAVGVGCAYLRGALRPAKKKDFLRFGGLGFLF